MNIEKTTMTDSKILEFAAAVLAAVPARQLKPATERFYLGTGRLYYSNAEAALTTSSKRTYYLRKAAITYFASKELGRAVHDGDAGAAATAMQVLARFTSGVEWHGSPTHGGTCPLSHPVRRSSKRASLRGLPDDWRQRVVAEASQELKQAILLMAATGVRPSEVEKGVEVTPVLGGVRVIVRGSKIDRNHGQPIRMFEVYSELAVALAQEKSQIIKVQRANQLSVEIGRLGRRLFGAHRQENVSAYSLRHAFASDLKAAEIPGDEISALLGHAVADTKKHYGSSRQGRMAVTVKLIHATRPVKSMGFSARAGQKPTGVAL